MTAPRTNPTPDKMPQWRTKILCRMRRKKNRTTMRLHPTKMTEKFMGDVTKGAKVEDGPMNEEIMATAKAKARGSGRPDIINNEVAHTWGAGSPRWGSSQKTVPRNS